MAMGKMAEETQMKKYYPLCTTQSAQIAIIVFFLLGLLMGYELCFQYYRPIEMAQKIEKLQAEVRSCESRWVREFSRQHGLIW